MAFLTAARLARCHTGGIHIFNGVCVQPDCFCVGGKASCASEFMGICHTLWEVWGSQPATQVLYFQILYIVLFSFLFTLVVGLTFLIWDVPVTAAVEQTIPQCSALNNHSVLLRLAGLSFRCWRRMVVVPGRPPGLSVAGMESIFAFWGYPDSLLRLRTTYSL